MIISLICLFLAGTCKAVSDTLSFNFYLSIFRNLNHWFWNPRDSWKNKYDRSYIILNNKTQERFPFSTTALVFLTDAWHLFNFFQYTLIAIGVVLFEPINISTNTGLFIVGNILIAKLVILIGFNICYDFLFKIKVWQSLRQLLVKQNKLKNK